MITPIEQQTLADTVEERLRAFIREQGFKSGDPLPKETEFAEQLNVSRNVVREALSRLRMLGIVESRKRRGMVMAGADISGVLSRLIHPQFVDDAEARNLVELRLVLEIGLADLLFQRRTDELLERLETIVAQGDSNVEDAELRVKSELAFHAAIYEATGNELLTLFQGLLQPFFRRVRESGFEDNYIPVIEPPNHRDILETLKTGTVDDYRRMMRAHLEPHFAALAADTEKSRKEGSGKIQEPSFSWDV